MTTTEIVVGSVTLEQEGCSLILRLDRAGILAMTAAMTVNQANELRDALNIWHAGHVPPEQLVESDE